MYMPRAVCCYILCACTDGIISLFAGLAVISEVLRELLPFRSREPLHTIAQIATSYIYPSEDTVPTYVKCAKGLHVSAFQ